MAHLTEHHESLPHARCLLCWLPLVMPKDWTDERRCTVCASHLCASCCDDRGAHLRAIFYSPGIYPPSESQVADVAKVLRADSEEHGRGAFDEGMKWGLQLAKLRNPLWHRGVVAVLAYLVGFFTHRLLS